MKIAKLTALLIVCVGALHATVGVGSARAAFGIESFTETYEDASGLPSYIAGGHPNVKTTIRMNATVDGGGAPIPDGRLKDIEVDLPAGFYGDPTVAPTCKVEELVAREGICATPAQVGVFFLEYFPGSPRFLTEVPVYKLPTTSAQTARLGAVVLGVLIRIDISVRTDGDYGLTAKILNANQGLDVFFSELVLWGVPADPANDANRFTAFATKGAPAGFAPRPFLSLPDRCEPVRTEVRADSWENPGHWVTVSRETPPLTGCDSLLFEPELTVAPQTRAANTPSGLDVDLTIPQDRSVSGRATPQLRKAVVTLPRGLAISPGSAAGLGTCSESQLAIGSNVEPTCPNSSKLGAVTVKTPVFEEDLTGSVFLGEPQPGNLFRLFMVLRGPGLLVKIPGIAKPDPVTGQITATFNDTPQLPFETLHMELKGGPRAPISTPTACGTYTTHAELTSWSSLTPVTSDSSFTIDQGCGNTGLFTPGFEAGTTNPIAGMSSPFTLRVIGQDGQQNLSGIETTLPEGVLAKLAGVPLCPGAVAATGACPVSSQVGTTTVGAGPGSSPIYVPQPGKAPTAAYLAGPYKGAPYSLVVKVPAQAGPFDLGTVTVRNALYVDPTTAQVTAKSDPLPQILEGVPIAYRDVFVSIDRPDFTLNPTSCEAMKVTSKLTSIEGATASPSDRFQVAGCGALGFKPKLSLALKGEAKRTGNPAVTAVLKMPKANQANIKKTTVILPKTEYIDNAHISNPCTRVQFAANECPKGSILGTARAFSPLLDKPLEGPVYFRSNGGDRELPDMVVDLDGQIHVTLVGFIDSVPVKGTESSRVRTRFVNVPDAPVSKFVLNLYGGKRGLIENSVNLCKAKVGPASVQMEAQNAKTAFFDQVVGTSCGGKKKKRK